MSRRLLAGDDRGWLLTAVVCGALAVAPTAVADPFYDPPNGLRAAKPGEILRAERIPVELKGAGRAVRVLYRSRSAAGKPVAVSGNVVFPAGKAPRDGWPVVSWAHGTVGIADHCAPSRGSINAWGAFTRPQVEDLLERGYVVTRTDYEGLGTRGTHPYLNGPSEARGAVDLVLAARRLDGKVSRDWVSAGFSQGGQAALFAGAESEQLAPRLRMHGVAAFAPASHIGVISRFFPVTPIGGYVSAYVALILEGAAASSPEVKLEEIESDRALALRPHIHERCAGPLGQNDSYGAMTPAEIMRPGADTSTLHRVLDAGNPAVGVDAPILLLQGATDTTVTKPTTDLLYGELTQLGNEVDYRVYPAESHASVVSAAGSDFSEWVRQRLGR
jgi:alpha-beta hydrolase superfamily lysophospholipase